VNSEEIALEVEMTILAEIGLTYGRREYMARFLGTSEEGWWQGLEADAEARLGRSVRSELQQPIAERMRAEITARLAEIPGAAAAIARVRQRRAVASSSGTASLHRKLEMVGHWHLFAPHVYSTDEVARPKPAPDLFLHVATKLGCDPKDCLVIEDSINGVMAGRAAGMRVWGFTGGRHHDDDSPARLISAGAERVLSSWIEGAEWFGRL